MHEQLTIFDVGKRCIDCGLEKPLHEFYRHPQTQDGRQGRCKPCHSKFNKDWYKQNAEVVKAKRRKYYEDNKDKCQSSAKLWAKKNPEKIRAYKRKYWDLNREKWRTYTRGYRTIKAQAAGIHNEHDIEDLFVAQDGLCAYCEVALVDGFHVDHMVPLSRGGGNDVLNLAITCPRCNCSKGAKTVEEFFQSHEIFV